MKLPTMKLPGGSVRPEMLTVNFHLTVRCNYECRYCFATFTDITSEIAPPLLLSIPALLAGAGFGNITFSGGEPTLHPHLAALIRQAHAGGLNTTIITNGTGVTSEFLRAVNGTLDWMGITIDSAKEETLRRIGRGRGRGLEVALGAVDRARAAGLGIKMNSVVTTLNIDEDLSSLVMSVRPERWKVFQALPVAGQNDGADALWVTATQYRAFIERHRHLAQFGFAPVAEENDDMRGSYVMLAPDGRFFQNTTGAHVYSQSIFEIGVLPALAEVGFNLDKYIRRGGNWDKRRASPVTRPRDRGEER